MTKPAVQPDPVAVITKALHDQEHEPVEDIVEGDPENIVCAGDEIVGQGMIEQMARSGWQMTRLRTEVGHLHRDVLWCGQCGDDLLPEEIEGHLASEGRALSHSDQPATQEALRAAAQAVVDSEGGFRAMYSVNGGPMQDASSVWIGRAEYEALRATLATTAQPTARASIEAPWSFEQMENMHEVRAHISTCEGQHVQQVAYSTYHDALTQVCFTERVVRSSLPRQLLQGQPTE